MLRLTKLAAAVLLPLLTGGALAAGADAPRIERAWARATPGSAKTGAAYFSVESPIDDRLISLESPVARKAELHTHIEEDGVMQMHAVEGGVTIAAHQPLELKPGGRLHVMLIDLNQKLKAGDRFPLVLTFEKAGRQEVTVKVEPLGAMGPSDDAVHGAAGGGTPAGKAIALDHSQTTLRPGQ
jgi:copper(I)-binding protein